MTLVQNAVPLVFHDFLHILYKNPPRVSVARASSQLRFVMARAKVSRPQAANGGDAGLGWSGLCFDGLSCIAPSWGWKGRVARRFTIKVSLLLVQKEQKTGGSHAVLRLR